MSAKKISEEVVQKIAILARICSSKKDQTESSCLDYELAAKQLSSILEQAESLSNINQNINENSTNNVGSTRVTYIYNLREDTPPANLQEYQKIAQNILTNAPKKKNNYFVVPRIIE